MINLRFFYNDGLENAGGGIAEVVEPQAPQEPQVVDKIELSIEQVKEWGFDSPEQLKEHFAKLKESNVPEDVKKKEEALDNLEFRRYAIANDLLKEDDFKNYESLTAKQAQDLVFEKYLADFKEDNPEIEDEEELLQAAKDDFETTYKLNSLSEKAKQRGLARIEKEAKELKNPVESSFLSAKEQFELAKTVAKTLPDFQNFVSEKVKQHTPDKAIIYKVKDGDVEIPVEIDITEEDRAAMVKEFSKHTNFHKFTKGDKAAFEAELDRKMQGWVKLNKADEIYSKAIETGINIGKSKAQPVGAENPFPLVAKSSNASATGNKTLDEEIRESHNKAARRFL